MSRGLGDVYKRQVMAILRITGTDAADNAATAASIPLTVARFFSSINEAIYILDIHACAK